MTMQTIIDNLTQAQALEWYETTDKYCWVDDNILEPAGLFATDRRVELIENALDDILTAVIVDALATK